MHPHIWYPFTQAKTALPPLKVKSAQGVWLELDDGRRLIDCISSWWVNVHGHAHPKVAEAIAHQAKTLEHVIFAGFTHDPAEQVAEKLVQQLPDGLERVFFSDNGSTAVEVAIKMAYQYWANERQPRRTFIAFDGSYHGDTFGSMAVGSRSIFTEVFSELLFDVDFLPFPATHLNDEQVEAKEAEALTQLEQRLVQWRDRYAGIIIEPLVQGAGGMRCCRPQFLQQVAQLAREAGVLLIFDEVMTGFGRTGDWFACLRAEVTPDIICLSKGLTAGFLPMAVTVCSEQIYQAFYSDDSHKTLYHGHSYTANPLGCAAALASIELMHHHQPVFSQMEAQHLKFLASLQDHPLVQNPRVMGTIAAFDLVTNEESGYLNAIAPKIRQEALNRQLLLRPLGNVLYIMPPYCITPDELTFVYEGIRSILG